MHILYTGGELKTLQWLIHKLCATDMNYTLESKLQHYDNFLLSSIELNLFKPMQQQIFCA